MSPHERAEAMEKTNEGPAFTVGQGIPEKPDSASGFKRPVRWLLSSHLIGSLKQIVLYSFTKRALDVRDWMLPSVDDSFAGETGELWFDYIADTGDGQLGVYDIAYLCMSDLHREAGSDRLTFDPTGPALSLPRGRFLMIGGDTAYHVADYPTLAARLQAPFEWAFVDLANEAGRAPDVRPLYGIPGNHDYYDELDGFNRQFRRPAFGNETTPLPGSDGSMKRPQLSLRGFRRTQETSYVALHLAHDWWLWGFDSENGNDDGKLDFRQTQFFRSLCTKRGDELSPPAKLIVATSEPAIARRLPPKADDRIIKSFAALGLKHPLLAEGRADLDPGTCRLDLSGDTHHYERYDADPDPTRLEQDSAPASSRSEPAPYASVVSGLGGAFLHPSDISHSGPARRAIFPPREDSRNAFPRLLLNPGAVFAGGLATVIGGLVSAIALLALWKSPTCSAAFHAVLGHVLDLDPLTPEERANGLQFLVHGSFLLALLVAAFGLSASGALRRWYHRQSQERERSRAWNVLGIGIAIVAALVPLATTLAVGSAASARTFTVDVLVGLLTIGLPVALVYFAIALGAKDHPRPRQLLFAVLGVSHALVQVVLPLAILRAQAWTLAIGLGVLPWVLLAIRTAAGRRWPRGLLPWIWFLVVAGAFAAVRSYAPPKDYPPDLSGPAIALVFVGVLVAGTYLTAFWFGFYLAASQEWHGHFNDVGGAARIDRYQQLIRFKVTAEGLTGYVIAIDAPRVHGRDLEPRIIDTFTIAPRGPRR